MRDSITFQDKFHYVFELMSLEVDWPDYIILYKSRWNQCDTPHNRDASPKTVIVCFVSVVYVMSIIGGEMKLI